MSAESRRAALEAAGLVHPRPEAVTAEAFRSDRPFFLAQDKVQVKYEMLRAVHVDGMTVSAAAAAHGYSRAEFYLVDRAFAERGMAGLVDGRRAGGGRPSYRTRSSNSSARLRPSGRAQRWPGR